jgi:hypothetical protein
MLNKHQNRIATIQKPMKWSMATRQLRGKIAGHKN